MLESYMDLEPQQIYQMHENVEEVASNATLGRIFRKKTNARAT